MRRKWVAVLWRMISLVEEVLLGSVKKLYGNNIEDIV